MKRFLSGMLAFMMLFTCISSNFIVKASDVVIVTVNDFGADPSGKDDSTQAFMLALEEVKKYSEEGKETILNFEYGEYRFDKDHANQRVYHTSNTSSRNYPTKNISMLLEDIDNLTIEGNGSTLLVYGDIMAMAVVNSNNITMQNFVLDYKDADTIDVSIVQTGFTSDGKPFADIFVPKAYNYVITNNNGTYGIEWQGEISPETNEPYWTWSNADFCAYLVVYKGYDRTVIRANNKEASNPFTAVTNIESISDTTVRFTYEEQLPVDVVEGNIYQLSNSAWRQTAGAFFWESSNLKVENVDVHYLSGFGWLTQMCKNVEFKGVDFLPREGSGKYTTSNADQLHVAGCGGYYKVTDCNFTMAHDDPINVHGTYMRVEEVIDNKTLRMKYIHGQQGGFRQFHENDEVLFYSRTYLESPDGQNENQPFVVASSIAPGELYNGQKLDLVSEIVTFKEALPASVIADLQKTVTKNNQVQPLYVAENVTYTPEVVISGNRMKSIPTRGILCTTRKPVIIENNIFDNMAMASIYLSNDADDWYESGPIRNMTIRNNTFYIRPTGQGAVGTVSGIFIEPITIGQWALNGGETQPKYPEALVHENITIEGNTFHISNDNVVTANRVDGLTIKNNTIIHDDPSLAISLNAPNQLSVNEKVAISATVSETRLGKEIFQFNDCRGVVVENNTYDEGLNLNIKTSKMDNSDLVNKDEILTLNAANNFKSSVEKVQFVSSDPSVAYVNTNNELVALSQGTTKLYAYFEKSGAILKSKAVEVHVNDDQQEPLSFSLSESFTSKYSTETIRSNYEDVTFELLDPFKANKASNIALIKDGQYIALKEGVAIVKATKGSLSATKVVVNSFKESYGHLGGLKNVTIESEVSGKVTSYGEDEITIEAMPNGNGIYTSAAYVNNIVNISVPQEFRQNLRFIVNVDGLVGKTSGWNSVGLMVYNDLDNYVFVGKRNHMDGISSMVEANKNCVETAGSASDNALTSTTFEFEIVNNTLKVNYLNAKGEWALQGTYDISNLQNDQMKIGLLCWVNGGDPFKATYGNIHLGQANETNVESLNALEYMALSGPYSNSGVDVEKLEVDEAEVNVPTKVTATLKNIDNDGLNPLLYVFTDVDGIKEFVVSNESTIYYTPKKAGSLLISAYAQDSKGKFGRQASYQSIVQVGSSSSNKLSELAINGKQVANFESDCYEYEVDLPYDLQKVVISVGEKDLSQNTQVNGVDLTQNYQVFDVADEFVITRRENTYKVKVNRIKSSDNKVESITLGNQVVDLSDEIKVGSDSYFVHVDEDQFTMKIDTSDEVSDIKVTRSHFEHEMQDTNSANDVFESEVNMYAGINSYYVYITAADGVSVREVKLYLFADRYSDSTLTGLKVNGNMISEFDASKDEYTIHIDESMMKQFNVEAMAKTNQTTSITYNTHRKEGNKNTLSLEKGLNKVIVTNVARDLWTKTFYTLNVIVDSNDNNNLLKLECDGKTLDINALNHEVNSASGELSISAKAQMDQVKMKMYLEGTNQMIQAYGNIEYNFKLKEGVNHVKLEVMALDGSVKTYEIVANAKGLVYASDVVKNTTYKAITNTKRQVGYDVIKMDKNVNGNASIMLADENGNPKEFAKGLATHASSEVIFQLESGHNYKTFEAFVGVDYVQYNTNQSTVAFEVWVDGVKKFESGIMRAITPMKAVNVNVEGATEVKLIVKDGGDGIGYDHAEWANACFTTPIEVAEIANYEALYDVLMQVYAMDANAYENFNAVNNVLETIDFDLPLASQNVVDGYVKALNDAVNALVKKATMNFEDVQDKSAWFYGSVEKAFSKGLMQATGKKDPSKPEAKFFEPDANITRGMVATVLYRMAGMPKVTYAGKFPDVANNLWYTNAIEWAATNGVVSGYKDGTFGPDANITRQDLAIMLRNYATKAGLATNATVNFDAFKDGKTVDSYAASAVAWCVEAKLMSGANKADGKYLNPKANATRAECAKMFALLDDAILANK